MIINLQAFHLLLFECYQPIDGDDKRLLTSLILAFHYCGSEKEKTKMFSLAKKEKEMNFSRSSNLTFEHKE